MEEKKKRKKKFKIPTLAFFGIALVIIIYFLPREAKYQYTYNENRPWPYGLLTAPYNFYIHKADKRIKAEEDSIMQIYQPYYKYDDDIRKKSVSLFDEDAKAQSVDKKIRYYIVTKLNEIYKAGVISIEDYDRIHHLNQKLLFLTIHGKENTFRSRHIASFFTPRQAYDKILNEKPKNIEYEDIKKMSLNDYLNVNILFDEETSNKAKNDLLKQVALYEGEIQQGEKIIDRGEIVTPKLKEILDSYNLVQDTRGGGHKVKPGWLILGEVIMTSLLLAALFFFLRFYRQREYAQQKNVIFILSLVVLLPVIVGTLVDQKAINFIYIIPFAIPTILVRTFIDSRTGMTVHIITVLICAMMLPINQIAQFIIIQMLVGYTSIFSLRHLAERSQLVICSLFILLTYTTAYTGWILATEGDYTVITENKWIYLYFCFNFVLVSFAYLLVYVVERIFGFISEVSMIELSNTNRPLLQRLAEVAPGTFQHSMQVSNLVVAGAQRIGANAALVRVGALYHDVGKMTNPAFFTENQTQGMNPHAGLTEKESAKIIIGHVAEGVSIAKKNNIPQQIIDFIETHHGKGKAKYFYNTYVNKHPDEEVDEADFTYPGRNPFSKETALLMMADTVEAASRSLQEYTKDSIKGLVDRLIDMQVKEGMFNYAPITFKDIEDVKEVYFEKLTTIYHTRIIYPEISKEKKEENK